MALFGRASESPLPVVAAATPGDCFYMIQEAVRIAVEFMTPVIFLSDAYLANGAEPWRIPKFSDFPPIKIKHPEGHTVGSNGAGNGHAHKEFLPYERDSRLVRPWAVPGTPGLEHRIGGLEKKDITGNVEYSPENHMHMTLTRAKKVANVAESIPLQEVEGPGTAKLLVVSWGSTYGAVRAAVQQAQAQKKSVTHVHLRYLNPLPKNFGDILKRYEKILVPELNMGHLQWVLRAKFLVDAQGYNKVTGKPFLVSELTDAINKALSLD